MCIKTVERYADCRCIYYSHAIDPCPAYGRHDVTVREVLIGHACDEHSVSNSRKALINDLKDLEMSSGASQSEAEFSHHDDTASLKAAPVDYHQYTRTESARPAEFAIESLLRSQLMEKFQRVPGRWEQFIPAGDLEKVMSIDAVTKVLQNRGPADILHEVYQHAKKTLAILLIMRELDALQGFITEGLRDDVLPLAMSTIDSPEDQKPYPSFSGWDLDTKLKFFSLQWMLLAPVFSLGDHLKVHDEAVLPFLSIQAIASSPFRAVHQVVIHDDHEKFQQPGWSGITEGSLYVLKQFTHNTENDNQRAFDREIAIMRSMGPSGHKHIIKLLATFEHRGQYSMIFPLAEENLRQFWAHSKPTSVMFHRYLEEMLGVAEALSFIHNDLKTEDSRPVIACHMDLKPENILIMKDNFSPKFTWKIADFGLSYFRRKESKLELPPIPEFRTYQPPECQSNILQPRSYDIWSLGCIFSECAAWLIKGSDAIQNFAEDRLNDVPFSDLNFRDDYFFTLVTNESLNSFGAITRPAVINWIEDLDHDPKCSKAISNLLHLVKNDLLQVNPSRRLNASDLSRRLRLIHRLQLVDCTAKEALELDARPVSSFILKEQITENGD